MSKANSLPGSTTSLNGVNPHGTLLAKHCSLERTPSIEPSIKLTGDPERDYNFFSIAAEYYSQGNGNFRDVSQNRRNDVFFNKDVGEFNVKALIMYFLIT